jgi:hypothetical protein
MQIPRDFLCSLNVGALLGQEILALAAEIGGHFLTGR